MDGQALPGMPADVDADGAVERADTTLNTPRRIRHDLAGDKYVPFSYIMLEEIFYAHDILNLVAHESQKLRPDLL
jgi:hypothetical protein